MRVLGIILVIVMAVAGSMASAQSIVVEEQRYRWEGDFCCGLNTDGGQIDLGAYYFLNDYVGFNLRLGMSFDPQGIGYFIFPSYDDYGYDSYYDERADFVSRLKLSPSLALRSPRIIYWKQLDAGIHLFCNPGVIFATGGDFNSRADYVAWDVKTGINLQYDRFVISLAYELTDMTLYSGMSQEKYMSNGGKYLTHAGLIGFGYKF